MFKAVIFTLIFGRVSLYSVGENKLEMSFKNKIKLGDYLTASAFGAGCKHGVH